MTPMKRPSYIRDIVVGSSIMYFYVTVACGTVSLLMYFQNTYWDKTPVRHPIPTWVYPTFTLVFPIPVIAMIWILFLKDSRHRKIDPYRFARNQYRFVELTTSTAPSIGIELQQLGYYIFVNELQSSDLHIEAGRIELPNKLQFTNKTHPLPFRLNIIGIRHAPGWRITIQASPSSSVVVADFRSTIYDSLEELVDKLNWRTFLRNWKWDHLSK